MVDYYREETHAGIREYNPVMDASDTEIAIRLAMTLGGTDLVILGADRRTDRSSVGECTVPGYSV